MTLPVDEYLFKDFIWNAVRLKKWETPVLTHEAYMTQQYRLGLEILKVKLPFFFKCHSSMQFNDLYRDITLLLPAWSNRLPIIAAFGYTQGTLIHELRNADNNMKESVGLTSSIFNICICLFDYIVDALPKGTLLFKSITNEYLQDLMDLNKSPFDNKLYKRVSPNNLVSCISSLVCSFSASCRSLYAFSKDDKGWQKLSSSIIEIYDAEKQFSRLETKNAHVSNNELLAKILKCKSVSPSIITYLISQLACPNSFQKQEKKVEEICGIIGSIFWISDDLADTANDLKSQTPSSISIKMKNIRHNRNLIFDEDSFYKLLISFVECLLNLLQKLDKKLKSMSVSTYENNTILEYVQMYVISWLANG